MLSDSWQRRKQHLSSTNKIGFCSGAIVHLNGCQRQRQLTFATNLLLVMNELDLIAILASKNYFGKNPEIYLKIVTKCVQREHG